MKKWILLAVLFSSACNNATEDSPSETACEGFKKGKFVYKMDGDTVLYSAERDAYSQKENEPGTNNITTYKVTWVSACSYDLTYQQKYEASRDTILQNNEGLVGRVTLLALRGDSMYFEVKITGVEEAMKGWMKKVK